MADLESKTGTQVAQLKDSISATVKNELAGVESHITQLDNSIDSKISDKTKQMDTRITQLSSSITSQVNSRLSGMESRVDQFDDLIKTKVTNRLSGMESQMAQMDDLIDAKVKDKAEGLTSEIAVMKGVITEQVEDKLKKVRSEITQVGDGIRVSVEGKADKKNLITQINASPEKLKLDSNRIEISGKTVFKDDVIIKGQLIEPNSIGKDKLKINSLDAISATIGTLRTKSYGARVEIRDNLILVYDNSNTLRVRIGVWNE